MGRRGPVSCGLDTASFMGCSPSKKQTNEQSSENHLQVLTLCSWSASNACRLGKLCSSNQCFMRSLEPCFRCLSYFFKSCEHLELRMCESQDEGYHDSARLKLPRSPDDFHDFLQTVPVKNVAWHTTLNLIQFKRTRGKIFFILYCSLMRLTSHVYEIERIVFSFGQQKAKKSAQACNFVIEAK